jgi:hypothetical protein
MRQAVPTENHEQAGSPSGSYDSSEEYMGHYSDEYDALLDDTSGTGDTPPVNNRRRAAARGYRPPYEKPSRRPAVERADSFNPLAWLIDGATGFVEEMRHNDLGLSEEFWVHASAAGREGLLAARALLDQLVEETQQQQTVARERQSRQSRRGGINVDF